MQLLCNYNVFIGAKPGSLLYVVQSAMIGLGTRECLYTQDQTIYGFQAEVTYWST